jgi:hypothetical protein
LKSLEKRAVDQKLRRIFEGSQFGPELACTNLPEMPHILQADILAGFATAGIGVGVVWRRK